MICAGVAAASLGAWMLFLTRPIAKGRDRIGFEGDPVPERGGLSVPTRYMLALGGLIAGYHLVVWAFPPSVAAVQLHRDRWWLWLLLLAIGLGLSFVMDRPGGTPPSPRDRGGSEV